MMARWRYSLLLIPLYVGIFLIWRAAPSRVSFVAGGLVTAAMMGAVIFRASRQGYFANRVDLLLHIYVVIDVLLESFAFELLLFGNRIGLLTAAEVVSLRELASDFHNNANFFGCTAVFIVLIGGHRWFALHRAARDSVLTETEPEPHETSAEPIAKPS